jgi:hypothetical protein
LPVVQLQQTRVSVPDEARTPCPDPVTLPDRRLSEAETTTSWSRDRGALRVCEQKRRSAVAAADAAGAKP